MEGQNVHADRGERRRARPVRVGGRVVVLRVGRWLFLRLAMIGKRTSDQCCIYMRVEHTRVFYSGRRRLNLRFLIQKLERLGFLPRLFSDGRGRWSARNA